MKQTNILDFLEDAVESAKQELHKLKEEAEVAKPKETPSMTRRQAINVNIEEVILKTLQAGPVTKEQAETLSLLIDVKLKLKAC